MKILSFSVSNFGILTAQTVNNLQGGLSIFLGQNEAGKSTCLEFFRTMLTGFPASKTKKSREGVFAHKNATMGGSIEFETQHAGILRLVRDISTCNLYNNEGSPLAIEVYNALLSGTTREIYNTIYGFSLAELQNINALETDEIKNVLYGTSFGMGFQSPNSALIQLEDIMNGGKGTKKTESFKNIIKSNFTALDICRENIQKEAEQRERYDSFVQEYNTINSILKELKNEKTLLNTKKNTLNTKISVWKQWEEWFLTQKQLNRLPDISDDFPLNGLSQLERLQDSKRNTIKNFQNTEEKITKLQYELNQKNNNAKLLTLLPEIQNIIESKASCRNALMSLPSIKTNIQRTEFELKQQLSYLGNDWNCERLHTIDRSLFVYSDLEQFAHDLKSTELAKINSEHTLQTLKQTQADIEDELSTLENTLNSLPEPQIELDSSSRELLRSDLQRTDDAKHRLTERKKHLNIAKEDYKRSLVPLKFKNDPSGQALLDLADSQDFSLGLADQIRIQAEKVLASTRETVNCKKLFEQTEEKIQFINKQKSQKTPVDRESITKKRSQIRRLHSLNSLIQQEEERLAELQDSYNTLLATLPITRADLVTLVIGIMLSCVGASMLFARFIFNMQQIDISFITELNFLMNLMPSLATLPSSIPLASWFGFIILNIGIICSYIGSPQISPDRKRKKQNLQQLGTRKEASVYRLSEINEEILALCSELNIDEPNPVLLDTLDAQLDKKHEQIVTDEKLEQDLALFEHELDIRKKALASCFAQQHAEENTVQHLRRQWHEHFRDLGVTDVPSPEGAAAYFARVDSVHMARSAVLTLETEIVELETAHIQLAKHAQQILPEHFTENTPIPTDILMERVQHILESCHETDAIIEQRTRTLERITTGTQNLTRAQKNLDAAHEKQSLDTSELEKIQNLWADYLKKLNLGTNLTPETARTALTCIERCINIESELIRLYDAKKMQEQERDNFIAPLKSLMEQLNKKPHLALDREPDWLATLDILQRDMEKAKNEDSEKNELLNQTKELQTNLDLLQKDINNTENSIKELVLSAHLSTAEEFVEHALQLEDMRSLQRRKQDLEDALKLATKSQQLEDFLSEFEGLELSILQFENQETDNRLQAIAEEEEENVNQSAILNAKITELENSEQIALLRQEEANITEQNKETLTTWLKYASAHALITTAKKKFEKERQPELMQTASEIFKTITNEKWINITAAFEENSLYINPPHGEPVTPDKLSQGTREQLYLALRLAHIQNSAKHRETLPVIMDDILVNFDPQRAKQTAKALAHLTDIQPAQQILFFTCHPHTADMLQDICLSANLYKIESGKII